MSAAPDDTSETGTSKLVSSKLREETHEQVSALANTLVTNRLEVLSAAVLGFYRLPVRRRLDLLREVRSRHPLRVPRVGRGNRKIPA